MAAGLTRRRTAAAVGTYASVGLGFGASIVAARLFSSSDFGLYSLVLASLAFMQVLLDLTIEEALLKFGFRYVTAEDWGRLRRLFRRTFVFKLVGAALGGLALAGLAVVSDRVFGSPDLRVPLLIAATIPLLQAPEGMAATALMLRGRYDVRGWFLAVSMSLRLLAVAVGAPHGLGWAMAALALAQGVSSLAIGVAGAAAFARYPVEPHRSLEGDAKAIRRFIVQSSVATGVVSLRSTLTPIVLGVVSTSTQVGYFKVAQSPQTGLNALSGPIRMVMLTEQTRDWERGELERVFAGVRRYTLLAAAGSLALLPPLLALMPSIVKLLFGVKYLGAVDAARVIVVAGAVQFVVGWSKSFAVTAGRPHLRVWTHGVESVILLPLAVLLGMHWGATGAAVAVLVSSVGFAVMWGVLYVRIRREERSRSLQPLERRAPGSTREARA
jgi:O-antigen/teichoic acid export membrane protein